MRVNKLKSKQTEQWENIGRIPPQALEVEASVLGCMMIDKRAVDIVLSILTPEMFYRESNQIICKAIKELSEKNEPIDTLTVVNHLRHIGEIENIGGPVYVAKLTREILSAVNVESHCRIVQEKFINREMIRIGSEMIKTAYSEEGSVTDFETAIDNLYSQITGSTDPIPAKDAMITTLIDIRKQKSFTGVPSGIIELDRITLGWQPGDLIIIGARPSMGKTAFAIQLAINAAGLGYKTLLFSLEMTRREISVRMMTNQTGVHYTDIKQNTPTHWQTLDGSCDREFTQHLYIDDNSKHDVYSMRHKLRKFVKKGGKMAIVDYLQLMDGEKTAGSRNEYIGEICRKIKQMAKELQIPIILLSQLNRDVEKRGNPFPILADLRDSGEIEQHADIVIFPSRYARLSNPKFHKDDNGNCLKGSALIDIAKHRNGEISKLNIMVSDDKSRWYDSAIEFKTTFEDESF